MVDEGLFKNQTNEVSCEIFADTWYFPCAPELPAAHTTILPSFSDNKESIY